MAGLDWDVLETARLQRDPFDHILVRRALEPAAAVEIPREFPKITSPGSFALADAQPGPVLAGVIADLQSRRFRELMEDLFGVNLAHRATTVTLRGRCGTRDGFVHTDSRSKVLSLLLYLNDDWAGGEGQLRLLRSQGGLHQPAVEVPAGMGSLVVFRRADNSWHGHTPFIGQRRVLQFNYVRADMTTLVSAVRHRLSALGKPRIAA